MGRGLRPMKRTGCHSSPARNKREAYPGAAGDGRRSLAAWHIGSQAVGG
jgi:hypothetical protein